MLDATVWGAAIALFTMPLCGMLADRIGFKWVFMAGTVGILLFSSQFFDLLQSLDPRNITIALSIAIGLVYACLYAPEGSLFAAQFPPRCATAASRLPCRCRAPSEAGWRRSSPRRC